jgi:AraC-like DNA-binding protein
MNIVLNGSTKADYDAQFFQHLILERDVRRPEKQYAIPGNIGMGSTNTLQLSGGIVLKWSDMSFHETSTIQSVVEHFHSEFNFCIEGAGAIEIDGKAIDGCVTAGSVQFMCGNFANGEAYIPQNQNIRQLSIEMTPLFWERMGIDPNSRYNGKYLQVDRVAGIGSMRTIREMLECPYVGHVRRLFLEGKAYELLALQMDELEPAGIIRKNSMLSDSDVAAIREAKHLIDKLLQTPPGLAKLSRMVGINDFKLKLGFKQVYGTTVFGYIRDERMNMARNLLERGECNVSQAAQAVGYESLPSFIRQFKKKYGCAPSECKLK